MQKAPPYVWQHVWLPLLCAKNTTLTLDRAFRRILTRLRSWRRVPRISSVVSGWGPRNVRYPTGLSTFHDGISVRDIWNSSSQAKEPHANTGRTPSLGYPFLSLGLLSTGEPDGSTIISYSCFGQGIHEQVVRLRNRTVFRMSHTYCPNSRVCRKCSSEPSSRNALE